MRRVTVGHTDGRTDGQWHLDCGPRHIADNTSLVYSVTVSATGDVNTPLILFVVMALRTAMFLPAWNVAQSCPTGADN